jgi:broad specificity phosphatase PhoE
MQITLVRHGRPAADLTSRIASRQFGAWLSAYELAEVDRAYPPPNEVLRAVHSCGILVCSPAARARSSAELLGLGCAERVLEDAAEAPLPTDISFPVPLNPTAFAVASRVLWRLGFARASESWDDVTFRARRLARKLEELSNHHGHVVLVSHGYMIRMLAHALEASGWYRRDSHGVRYWSHSRYDKAT